MLPGLTSYAQVIGKLNKAMEPGDTVLTLLVACLQSWR
ncbi:hypothetical protein JCM19233_1810 [Vibrio astriarenae]|nr:hypothetical protein JCM19233_1810 [Vibrio sp. C7]